MEGESERWRCGAFSANIIQWGEGRRKGIDVAGGLRQKRIMVAYYSRQERGITCFEKKLPPNVFGATGDHFGPPEWRGKKNLNTTTVLG